PLLGGALAAVIGYRSIFYVVAVICAVGGLVGAAALSEPRTGGPPATRPTVRDNLAIAWQHPDVRRALLAIVASQTMVTTLQPIFVLYVEQVGVAPRLLSTTTGFLYAATGITALVAAPWWGRRGDRLGFQGALATALLGSSLLLLLQGVINSVAPLLALR